MHDDDLTPADDALRTHVLTRSSATLGVQTWSRVRQAIQRLVAHFQPLAWSIEMTDEKLVITRWDAAEDADQAIVVERRVPVARWNPNDFGHQHQKFRLDGQKSALFVETVLMLFQIHYPDKLSVASTVGYVDWQVALMHLMEGAFEGPWVDRRVIKDPATKHES